MGSNPTLLKQVCWCLSQNHLLSQGWVLPPPPIPESPHLVRDVIGQSPRDPQAWSSRGGLPVPSEVQRKSHVCAGFQMAVHGRGALQSWLRPGWPVSVTFPAAVEKNVLSPFAVGQTHSGSSIPLALDACFLGPQGFS